MLILEAFGLKPLSQAERLDLLELINDRHGRRSTLLTSQLPLLTGMLTWAMTRAWADALLDRLLSTAHRLELKGVEKDGARVQSAGHEEPTAEHPATLFQLNIRK